MRKIGLISDTHGTFDEKVKNFLSEVDEIWHAGDIGNIACADAIAAFKPMRAVYGNIDDELLRRSFHQFELFDCEQMRVAMTHIGGYPAHYDRLALEVIRRHKPTLFICGHSHILKVMYDKQNKLMCINPGAAGIYGFHRVRTAIRFTIDGDKITELEVGEWER